jgi:hypothetical protein
LLEWVKRFFPWVQWKRLHGSHSLRGFTLFDPFAAGAYEKTSAPFNPCEPASRGLLPFAATATQSASGSSDHSWRHNAQTPGDSNKKAISFASFSLWPDKENDAGWRAGTRRS